MLDFAGGHDPRNPQRREKRYSEKLLRQRKQFNAIRQEKLRSIGARTEHVRSTYGARWENTAKVSSLELRNSNLLMEPF